MTDHLDRFSSADDSDEDDEDYKPDAEVGELPSECESGNDSEHSKENGESNEPHRNKKKPKRKKIQCVANQSNEATADTGEKLSPLNEHDEKQKADALWADFLKDTDTESIKPETETVTDVLAHSTDGTVHKKSTIDKAQIPTTKFVKKIFEFAGDTVEVECRTDAIETAHVTKPSATPQATVFGRGMHVFGGGGRSSVKRSSVGGLGSVLGQIGKKTKIGTLEKSKLDWNSFKRQEGIDEQLQTHNKGKDGYLERQDFLQRTDVRQFQIEKSLRLTKR